MHVAAHSGANASILALVRHCQADVDARIRPYADGDGDISSAQEARQRAAGGMWDATPLFLATQGSHLAAVKALLRLRADVNSKTPVDSLIPRDSDGGGHNLRRLAERRRSNDGGSWGNSPADRGRYWLTFGGRSVKLQRAQGARQ